MNKRNLPSVMVGSWAILMTILVVYFLHFKENKIRPDMECVFRGDTWIADRTYHVHASDTYVWRNNDVIVKRVNEEYISQVNCTLMEEEL